MLKCTLTLRDQQTAMRPHLPQGSVKIMIIIIIIIIIIMIIIIIIIIII